jgi:uncharacterized protein YpbB
MSMMQIEIIILHCLRSIKNERTIYSIFHLLKGKKSSQTIQDAHLFSIKQFFGILEPLSREDFEDIIAGMLDKELIMDCGGQRFIPAPSGESALQRFGIPIYLNGWEYHQMTEPVWERLSLLVQVASNLEYGEANYIPIQKSPPVHAWIKTVLKESLVTRKEFSRHLYEELTNCFSGAEGMNPSAVVFRLTGFQQIGLTAEQAAKKLKLNFLDYLLEFIHTLHYIIQKIRANHEQYPLLAFLLQGFSDNGELTISSRKTWNLLVQGYTPEMIARLRSLKQSTIEDHLVEFALSINHFQIDDYVDRELQTEILEISRQQGTRQLKVIRDNVKRASYFQIRLVLAKYGEITWN